MSGLLMCEGQAGKLCGQWEPPGQSKRFHHFNGASCESEASVAPCWALLVL